MGLRFVNTARWQKKWWRTLPTEWKVAFDYIWDTADAAGIWPIEPDLVKFHAGVDFRVSNFVKACNSCADLLPDEKATEHVRVLPDGKHLWLVFFVITQNPTGLNAQKVPAHRPIIRSLLSHGLTAEVSRQYATLNITDGIVKHDQEELPGVPTEAVVKDELLAKQVLEHLNKKTKAHFRPAEGTLRSIIARLGEGHTVAECRAVIDVKTDQWLADKEMCGYLRPETLFRASKFQSYLAEVHRTKQKPKHSTPDTSWKAKVLSTGERNQPKKP